MKPSKGIVDTLLEEESGLAYIPLISSAPERNQKLTLMPSFSLEEMESFHIHYQKETESCSAESDKQYRLWKKMYHPHLEASGDGPSSFQDSFIHTPVKEGQQGATVAVLPRPHSTIQHMQRCPSPPTSLMPKTSCCVLTSAENLKNIDDKQKKRNEEAQLKKERWKEQKKKTRKKTGCKMFFPQVRTTYVSAFASSVLYHYYIAPASVDGCLQLKHIRPLASSLV